jgi:hypothetical protein
VAHREVVDADGVWWELWEVQPTMAEKRETEHPVPPATGERRQIRSVRSRLPGEMADGWLAMKSATERRRIAPIPPGWPSMSTEELRALINRGTPTGTMRRIVE